MPTKLRKTVSPSGRKAGTDDAAPAETVKPPKAFFDGVKELIESARATVTRGIDLVQVHTNFEIGRRIVQEKQRGQNRAAYGARIVQQLAGELTEEFGRGHSWSNLKSMRQFYLKYSHRISQTASGQLAEDKKSKPRAGRSISQSVTGQLSSEAIGQQTADHFPNLQPLVRESRSFCLSWFHIPSPVQLSLECPA